MLSATEIFKKYTQYIFLPNIFGQLQHALWLDLVWGSQKQTFESNSRKEVHQCVADSAPIPGSWQNHLPLDLTKKNYIKY